MPSPFMFDPLTVAERLHHLPNLAKVIRPGSEGEPSVAFDGWRKSRRQIVKLLANEEPEHGFEALLERVDHWLGRGFSARALRARDRPSFRSGLSELGVADHFEVHGFEVLGFDEGKDGEQVADMRVSRDGLAATVEVYSPIEWEGLDYLIGEGWDTLRHLDVPFNYLFRYDLRQSEVVPLVDGYRQLHPSELSAGLASSAERRRILQPIFDELRASLADGLDEWTIERTVEELNLSVSVALEHVQTATTFPLRAGVHGGPGFGGYSPEFIFCQALRRALAKAVEGQALSGDGGVSALIVDLARLPLESELSHEGYQRLFFEKIGEIFPSEGSLPVDLIALCRSRGLRSDMHTYWAVWDEDRIDRGTCEALLGPLS